MFSFVLLVLSANILLASADNNEQKIQFDEATLTKLRLSPSRQSTTVSYDEFELFNEHQCAIECVKDKNTCTGYTYTASNKICALFDDSNASVESDLLELRQALKGNPCDKVKCQPGAICFGDVEAKCVCLNGQPTPEDCDHTETGVWTDFDAWSTCSVTCGEGFRSRKRECLSAKDRTKKIPYDQCIGKHIEIDPCEVKSCPSYGPWSTWTPCSTFCGIGTKQRNRSCVPPGSNCGNYTYEQRACGEANCQRVAGIKETEPEKYPMKGYLALREGDILCVPKNSNESAKHMADLICRSIGFARGAQYAVLNPLRNDATCYPGIICDGTENTFFECKYDRSQSSNAKEDLFAVITRCIVDGEFSAWSEWTPCTKSCGSGQMTRSRTCTEPAPSVLEAATVSSDRLLAGKNCTGEYTQVNPCNEQKC